MAITLRTVKGSTLTYGELDGNFTDLDTRVTNIETSSLNNVTYTADASLLYASGTYDFGNNIITYSNAIDQEADLANYDPGVYHGMTMHVHSTGALYYAHAGEWRKLLTDTTYNNVESQGYVDSLSAVAYSGDYNSLSNTPTVPSSIDDLTDVSTAGVTSGQILKYDGTAWVPSTDATADSGSGITLADLSVSVLTAGTANLSYDNTTGVFTYTPPAVPDTILDLGISDGTSGQVLSTDGSGNFSFVDVSSVSGLDNVVEDSTPQLGGDLDVNGNSILHTFDVTNNGTSAYTFSDLGNHWFPTSEDNPVLYLRRGETYAFDVNASGHPFEIRVADGGSAYTTGVTNNGEEVGQVLFKVPMSAPSTLYYQCTVHSGMGNTINIV